MWHSFESLSASTQIGHHDENDDNLMYEEMLKQKQRYINVQDKHKLFCFSLNLIG